MAILWVDQHDGTVASLVKLYAGFSFTDNGKRIALPVKYNDNPLAKAMGLLDMTEPFTAYGIGSISAQIELNSDVTRPQDPGAEPRGETFKYKARQGSAIVEDDLSYHVPGWLSDDPAAIQEFGEATAAYLSEAGLVVRFVGTAGSGRR